MYVHMHVLLFYRKNSQRSKGCWKKKVKVRQKVMEMTSLLHMQKMVSAYIYIAILAHKCSLALIAANLCLC